MREQRIYVEVFKPAMCVTLSRFVVKEMQVYEWHCDPFTIMAEAGELLDLVAYFFFTPVQNKCASCQLYTHKRS